MPQCHNAPYLTLTLTLTPPLTLTLTLTPGSKIYSTKDSRQPLTWTL